MFNLFRQWLISKLQPATDAATPTRKFEREQLYRYDGIQKTDVKDLVSAVNERTFQRTNKDLKVLQNTGDSLDVDKNGLKTALDSNIQNTKALFAVNDLLISPIVANWYAGQGFIGYQLCAILAQNWLIDKAITMPAEDAIRNGYETTVNDGTEVEQEVLDAIREEDTKRNINEQLKDFVRKGRMFGIRIALFVVESDDPDYYLKPFNQDGVMPNSYKGISQIDPYWITPELDFTDSSDPAAPHFYEPTWWRVNGQRIHRSHLAIMRTDEVADILKPTYFYGGIPLPQKIYNRVYAAERTADEAPELTLTKRTMVVKTDTAQAIANQREFEQRMQIFTNFRTNYGVQVVDIEEEVQQLDTALADVDTVIMTQFQLVAAIARVPATRLLGTQPKGFNSSGDYEEKSYHEELRSIQTHYLTAFLERHHLLLIRSEIAPKFSIKPFNTTVRWNPLAVPTQKEKAEINKMNAETGAIYVVAGVIDAQDERTRIINDPESGYNGLSEELVMSDDQDPEDDMTETNEDEDTLQTAIID